MINLQLSDDEAGVVDSALYALLSETEHYLRGYSTEASGHGTCCEVAAYLNERRLQEKYALQERLRHINRAILSLKEATT